MFNFLELIKDMFQKPTPINGENLVAFPLESRINKTRMIAITTAIQHSIKGRGPHNKRKKVKV